MTSEDDVFLQIKKWTMEEKVFKVHLPRQVGISWAIELAYPFNHPTPMPIVILNQTGTDSISLQISMKMGKECFLLKAKSPAALKNFYFSLQTIFLDRDVAYNTNMDNNTWIIVDTIFFDGLTKNELFKAIRHVHDSACMSNLLLAKAIQ